jgi:hypothetical protein
MESWGVRWLDSRPGVACDNVTSPGVIIAAVDVLLTRQDQSP